MAFQCSSIVKYHIPQALGIHDLMNLYFERFKSKIGCLSDLILIFMRNHPDDHIFIDEFPSTLIKNGFKAYYPFQIPQDLLSLTQTLWITSRPREMMSNDYEKHMNGAMAHKEELRQQGFHIPHLPHNMRNSSNVHKAIDSIYTSGKQKNLIDINGTTTSYEKPQQTDVMTKEFLKFSVPKANIPLNTVPGNRPLIIPIMRPQVVSDVVVGAIKQCLEPEEPVVILVVKKREFSKTVDKCKSAFEHTRNIVVYQTRGTDFKEEHVDNLRRYLENPEGILITDADAFAGMQARSVVVLGDSSRLVRNYIMRAISFVVLVQDKNLIDNLISLNPDVDVDKSFLLDRFKNDGITLKGTTTKNCIWLWHIPYGTTIKDIKEHIEKCTSEGTVKTIKKLKHKNEDAGFMVEVDNQVYKDVFLNCKDMLFWPPGWRGRKYTEKAFYNIMKQSGFKVNLSPQELLVKGPSPQSMTSKDVSEYLELKEIGAFSIKQHSSVSTYTIKVTKEDYKIVIAPSFWTASGWKVLYGQKDVVNLKSGTWRQVPTEGVGSEEAQNEEDAVKKE